MKLLDIVTATAAAYIDAQCLQGISVNNQPQVPIYLWRDGARFMAKVPVEYGWYGGEWIKEDDSIPKTAKCIVVDVVDWQEKYQEYTYTDGHYTNTETGDVLTHRAMIEEIADFEPDFDGLRGQSPMHEAWYGELEGCECLTGWIK